MLMVTLLVGCAIACQARPSTSYYRPYYQEKYYVSDGYDNGDGYRSHEDSGNRQRHHSHANHEASEYDSGAAKSLKDRIKKNRHSEGAKEAVHASGGKEEHGKKSHDKAFYEREKKYGYEKSYGYEKETKHHDKGSVSHSSGSNYNHKENKEHHNSGEQFLRDLAEEAKKFDRGSKSQGSKSDHFDSSSHRNIGKDIESELARSMKFFKRSGPISNYSPNFVPKEYLFGLDKGFNRMKYMSGIHGLGGLRAHGLNYGFNPVRYRYSDNHVASTKLGFMPHGDLLFNMEHPTSSVLYYDPDLDI